MSYLGATDEDLEQKAASTGKSVEEIVLENQQTLAHLKKVAEDDLAFRRIATFATVAGAAFAMLRLSEIYITLQERKERRATSR